MLAEQVWDGRPPTRGRAGEGTRSATPLTWSHAGLIRLAWTIQRGRPVDQQAIVADRYTELPSRRKAWRRATSRSRTSTTSRPDAVLPALDGLPQVASVETSEHRLEATYFDTTNLRLAAAGITVRRRTGGADDGWHLKLPADGARHEVTVGLGRGKATVPKRLRDTVRVFVGDEALGPIATLRTHRTEHRLLDESGRLLAVVSDDLVTAEVETRETGWREWEVELAEGDDALLKAAAALLRDAGARPSTARSKLARAVGDRLTAAGHRSPPRHPGSRTPRASSSRPACATRSPSFGGGTRWCGRTSPAASTRCGSRRAACAMPWRRTVHCWTRM